MTAYRPNCRRIPELNGLRVLLVFIVSWYHFWQLFTPNAGMGSGFSYAILFSISPFHPNLKRHLRIR